MTLDLFDSVFYDHIGGCPNLVGYNRGDVQIFCDKDIFYLEAFGNKEFLLNTKSLSLDNEKRDISMAIRRWLDNNPRSKFSTNVPIEVEVEGLGLF